VGLNQLSFRLSININYFFESLKENGLIFSMRELGRN
jgi:hypothetical protein